MPKSRISPISQESPLILASASPRRVDLLQAAAIPFLAVPARGVDETPLTGESPQVFAQRMAWEKVQAVAPRFPARWVLGVDTVVTRHGIILGKPTSPEDAVRMLELLSDGPHEVCSGVALLRPDGKTDTFLATTIVHFRRLTTSEIHAYVATGEPMDKAGAYAIQGGAADFVTALHGSHANVVGLPIEQLREYLFLAG